MTLTSLAPMSSGGFQGYDKNGANYKVRVEDTDLVHSKTKKKGYRISFITATTNISFVLFDDPIERNIQPRLEKIGYVFQI